MNRNEREQELIRIRRLRRLEEELDKEADKVEHIELEQPQFAGWDVWLTLSDERMRSNDAHDLLTILGVTRMMEPLFVHNERYIRDIRRSNYKYTNLMQYRAQKGKKKTKHFAKYWSETVTKPHYKHAYRTRNYINYPSRNRSTISEKDYKSLPEKYRRWFVKHEEGYKGHWSHKIYYTLSWKFPWYELVFKVKKSYYTSMAVPNGDAIGEAEKLHDRLWHGHEPRFFKSFNGKWDGRWRDDFTNGIKNSWRTVTKKFKTLANAGELDYEGEEYALSRTKAFNRAYGWD